MRSIVRNKIILALRHVVVGAAVLAVWGLNAASGWCLDAKALSRELDELYRSQSSRGLVSMTVTTPHYTRQLKMKIWSRSLEDTLIRIISPPKEKGTATLKRGNEMWNYLPKIRKTIRVPPSMMMGSWMGSDFTNDDLVKETTWEEDYHVSLVKDPPPGLIGLIYQPKENAPVTWSRIAVSLDQKTHLPVTFEYYDEKERQARVMSFSEVKALGGRTIPARLTLTPLSEEKKGQQTILVYEELEFDLELPPDLFTLTNLRRER